MMALWMLYATAVTAVLGAGAASLEQAAGVRLRQRRWVWLLALGLAVVLPVWTAVAPTSPPVRATLGTSGSPTVEASRASLPNGALAAELAQLVARADTAWMARLDSPLAILWALAAGLAMAGYGVAAWSLARHRRSWRDGEIDGQAVLLAPAVGPAVVGALKPRIVVPEWSLTLPAEQRALMLTHEREHVRARDPLLLHVAAFVALVMPWNLAAWWLNRRLRLAVELDCDARVLDGGRDARAYGTLLLDVCTRRTRGAPFLAPALLERTSPLTKRILAMHPERRRFPRARFALGSVAALGLVILACEMPTPEMLAPDGKNAPAAQVFGTGGATANEMTPAALRGTVARYFPAVARGDGGPAILFIVRSPDAGVVLTEMQPANALPRARRLPLRDTAVVASRSAAAREAAVVAEARSRPRVSGLRLTAKSPSEALPLPAGVGALRPDDIKSIEISKHAAGTIAPQAVSVIYIMLKPGAAIPKSTRAF